MGVRRGGRSSFPFDATSDAYARDLGNSWRALLTLVHFGFDPVSVREVTGEIPEPPPGERTEPGVAYWAPTLSHNDSQPRSFLEYGCSGTPGALQSSTITLRLYDARDRVGLDRGRAAAMPRPAVRGLRNLRPTLKKRPRPHNSRKGNHVIPHGNTLG